MIALYGYSAFALIPFVALLLLSNFEAGWRALLLIGALGALIVLPFRATLPASPRWMIARGRHDEAEATVAECEARVGPRAISGKPPLPPVAGESHDFPKYVVLFLGIWLTYLIVDDAWLTLPTTLLTDRGLSVTASIAALSLTGIGFVAALGFFMAVPIVSSIGVGAMAGVFSSIPVSSSGSSRMPLVSSSRGIPVGRRGMSALTVSCRASRPPGASL